MRTVCGIALMILLLPAVGMSQEASSTDFRNDWAFFFMAPSLTNDPQTVAAWHIGAGYERLFTRYVGVSAGAGAVMAGVRGGDWGFPVSVNGLVYMRRAPQRTRVMAPFVSVGYTRGGISESSNMVNVGAGFNQWTQGPSGFRFEVRHHVDVERGPEQRNWLLDFRLGFVLR